MRDKTEFFRAALAECLLFAHASAAGRQRTRVAVGATESGGRGHASSGHACVATRTARNRAACSRRHDRWRQSFDPAGSACSCLRRPCIVVLRPVDSLRDGTVQQGLLHDDRGVPGGSARAR